MNNYFLLFPIVLFINFGFDLQSFIVKLPGILWYHQVILLYTFGL